MTIEHIDLSISNALNGVSNLNEGQLSVSGFSTRTMRHLFNNLTNINGTYLEIGLYCGGTFCSAFNKDLTAIGIENYSQDFGVSDVKSQLERNVDLFQSKAKEVHLHFTDCFTMDKSVLPDNIDIFFYDGHHDEEYQAKALPHFIDKMAKRFIYIADDFNWASVFNGTNKALKEVEDKITILRCWPLRGYSIQDDPIFHNGVAIYLIEKK